MHTCSDLEEEEERNHTCHILGRSHSDYHSIGLNQVVAGSIKLKQSNSQLYEFKQIKLRVKAKANLFVRTAAPGKANVLATQQGSMQQL